MWRLLLEGDGIIDPDHVHDLGEVPSRDGDGLADDLGALLRDQREDDLDDVELGLGLGLGVLLVEMGLEAAAAGLEGQVDLFLDRRDGGDGLLGLGGERDLGRGHVHHDDGRPERDALAAPSAPGRSAASRCASMALVTQQAPCW